MIVHTPNNPYDLIIYLSKYVFKTRTAKTYFKDPFLSIPIALHLHLLLFFHSSDIAFIDEIRCAKKAFAVSLDNSEDQTLVVNILSTGTQLRTHQPTLVSLCPSSKSLQLIYGLM
jgi:hypothetical protein